MSEPDFVDVWEGPSVADVAWLNAQDGAVRDTTAHDVRIVDFPSFIATEEPSSEPLLGTAADTILPLEGTLLMYGDGGSGKTTLTIDAVSHLGSGEPWLGIAVERPVKTLLIENEGPRGKFRQRLAEKHASWNGHVSFAPNVHVLEEPWTRFTLRDRSHRTMVARAVDELELDLVVMGPLVTLGMVGGGTPDEVQTFEDLMRLLRAEIERPFSFWIIHHENKAGDISGAWDRVPDALCHVQAQGNGYTKLVWEKARWADGYHGVAMELTWADGRTYVVKEDLDRDLHADILSAFGREDEWRTVKETRELVGAREADVKQALSDLVDRGEMTFMKGAPGRSARALCYRLVTAPDKWEHTGAVRPLEGIGDGLLPALPPLGGSDDLGAVRRPPESAPTGPGAHTGVDDEEIGF